MSPICASCYLLSRLKGAVVVSLAHTDLRETLSCCSRQSQAASHFWAEDFFQTQPLRGWYTVIVRVCVCLYVSLGHAIPWTLTSTQFGDPAFTFQLFIKVILSNKESKVTRFDLGVILHTAEKFAEGEHYRTALWQIVSENVDNIHYY